MLKQIIAWAKEQMYNLSKVGFSFPVAGATGIRTKTQKQDQQNATRSKLQMKKDWGSQPHLVGARRLDRQAQRLKKRKNSFCNNLHPEKQVEQAS